jgi:hypothetical protein
MAVSMRSVSGSVIRNSYKHISIYKLENRVRPELKGEPLEWADVVVEGDSVR